MFQECVKKVLRVFLESFKGVMIEGCFKRILSGLQGYLKEVQREYKGSFKGVLSGL